MKRWGVILIVLWASVAWADPFVVDDCVEDGFVLPAYLTAGLATEIDWSALYDEDYYTIDLTFSDTTDGTPVVFSVAMIVEYLELAVRLIGGVNEAPVMEIVSTFYVLPPKPSEILKEKSREYKLKADRLEHNEQELQKIKDFIKQLRRIEE